MGKGTIGILTGGGDVPGLNPAIRAITIRALRDGYKVIGIRHGWGGLVDYSREKGADNADCILPLTEAIVNRAGRTGGTFLHTSRTRPSHLPKERVPAHLVGTYTEKINDIDEGRAQESRAHRRRRPDSDRRRRHVELRQAVA